MKKHIFPLFVLCFLLNACASGSQYVSIDSNVSADVYENGKFIGVTPFGGKIARKNARSVTLKKRGYKTASVPLQTVFQRSKKSSVTQVSRKIWREYDAAPFLITSLIPFAPTGLLRDAVTSSNGNYVEYMPNMYYIDLVPETEQTPEASVRAFEIKRFALVNYPDLALNRSESVGTLAALSGISEDELKTALKQSENAPAFVQNIMTRNTLQP